MTTASSYYYDALNKTNDKNHFLEIFARVSEKEILSDISLIEAENEANNGLLASLPTKSVEFHSFLLII